MKTKKKGINTVIFQVINEFLDTEIFRIQLQWHPKKAIYGKYSQLWKSVRRTSALTENVSVQHIKLKYWFQPDLNWKHPRIIMSLPSGLSIDLPNDLSELDFKILRHHLEGFKLACTK